MLWTPPKKRIIDPRPRFEVAAPRVLRKYIDGQWQPGQKFQFQGGNVDPLIVDAPVSYIDDGDFAGGSGTTVNVTGITTVGPVSVFLVSTRAGGNRNAVSATLNGVACSLLTTTNANRQCAAIFIINAAAASHTLAITFNGSVDAVNVTAVSLQNLQSLTPIDTKFDSGGTFSSINLPAITGPGSEGIVLCAFASYDADTISTNWTNATEIADLAFSTAGRASSAVVLGNPVGTISAAMASSSDFLAIVGASLR